MSVHTRAGCSVFFLIAWILSIVAAIEDRTSHVDITAGEAPLLATLDYAGVVQVQERSHRDALAENLLRRDGMRAVQAEHRDDVLNGVGGALDSSGADGRRELTRRARTEGAQLHVSDSDSLMFASLLEIVANVSIPVLGGAMLFSFLAGMCCVVFCINLHGKKVTRPGLSTPLLGGRQHGQEVEAKEYSFQTVDPQDNKTRYWRWCAESRVQELGVLTQAPKRPFENFSQIDVEAEEEPVMTVLSRADVDFHHFNVKRHMEGLLLKLVRGECFFMAVDDASKVLLMVESVRIRCIDKDFVLVREPDQSLLAKRCALPGVEKPTSEPPVVAAKKMWSGVLKMPNDSAEFIEDSIEDKEVVGGYNGIRCVERCHVIAVRFRKMSEAHLAQLGLPSHSAFEASSEGEPAKRFSWKRLADCDDIMGLKFGGNEHTGSLSIRGSVMANSSESEHLERIKDFLRSGGIDSDKLGESEGKLNVKKLCEEVRTGTCVLEKTERGLQRCVNSLMIRLWSPDESLILVQSKSATDAAEVQLPEVEKDMFENLTSAAARLLKRDLLLAESDIKFDDERDWEYYDEVERSTAYPGLWTKQQKFFVNAVLLDDDVVLNRVGLPTGPTGEESGEGF